MKHVPMNLEALMNMFKEQAEKHKLQMKGIQRYKIVDGVLVQDDAGDIVKFLDHALETEKLRLEIRKSYTSGYDSGKDSGYSWRL